MRLQLGPELSSGANEHGSLPWYLTDLTGFLALPRKCCTVIKRKHIHPVDPGVGERRPICS
jgi:hypothetical protein